jgi:hypothetical protein
MRNNSSIRETGMTSLSYLRKFLFGRTVVEHMTALTHHVGSTGITKKVLYCAGQPEQLSTHSTIAKAETA